MELLTVQWAFFNKKGFKWDIMGLICDRNACSKLNLLVFSSRRRNSSQIISFTSNEISILSTIFSSSSTPIVFRQPPLSAVANIFVLPLSSTVWKCTFGLLMVIFVITVCQFFHPHLRTALSFMDIGTFVMGAFCQQGTYLSQTFSNTSGRAVILVTFLAALALFTSYSASIVALLQSPSAMIKSLEDLIASPLNVYIHEGGYTRFYLLKYNDSVIHNLYESKVQKLGTSAWIYDPFDGIERVRTQLIAFQVDSQSAYKAIAKTYSASEKCSLGEIQMIQLPLSTVPLERNSGYKELVKQRLAFFSCSRRNN